MNPLYKSGIAIAFLAIIFGYGHYAGKGACESKQQKETIKVVEKVRYVRQKVQSMPDAVVADELRKWQRD